MSKRRAAGIATLVAFACAVPAAEAVQTRSQLFFRDKLLSDTKTSTAIKDLLRSGGFVEKGIVFGDLTGDDRDDALVRVNSGGATGVVAIYVFSTDGAGQGSALAAVYRAQRVTRGSARVRSRVLSFRSAVYAVGDEVCCPSRIVETTLRWSRAKRRFTVARRRDVSPPSPTP